MLTGNNTMIPEWLKTYLNWWGSQAEKITEMTLIDFSINKTAEAVGVSRSTVIRVRKNLKNSS